jgi:hypothetical protein
MEKAPNDTQLEIALAQNYTEAKAIIRIMRY